MRRWFGVVASVALVTILTACATTSTNVCGSTTPPAGAFALDFSSCSVRVTKGNANGTTLTVTVTFGAAFEDNVRLTSNNPTSGVTVTFNGQDINQQDLILTFGQSVDLQVVAASNADDENAFMEIIGQGISDSGSTSGRPRMQGTIRLRL